MDTKIKYVSKNSTRSREEKAILKAMEVLGRNSGMIITAEHEESRTVDGKTIEYIPLYKWLLLIPGSGPGRLPG